MKNIAQRLSGWAGDACVCILLFYAVSGHSGAENVFMFISALSALAGVAMIATDTRASKDPVWYDAMLRMLIASVCAYNGWFWLAAGWTVFSFASTYAGREKKK